MQDVRLADAVGALNLPRVAWPQHPRAWQLNLTARDGEKALVQNKILIL